MATISTHTLNSVDGSHAADVRLSILRIAMDGRRETVVTGATDEGGRFVRDIPEGEIDTEADYELVLQVANYFELQSLNDKAGRNLKEVVVRFQMPDPTARYHMPFMLAPNSYSVWMAR
ncbi:MAG: hydroxyisourate hydrolase [Rhizobiaceae bacterium]